MFYVLYCIMVLESKSHEILCIFYENMRNVCEVKYLFKTRFHKRFDVLGDILLDFGY